MSGPPTGPPTVSSLALQLDALHLHADVLAYPDGSHAARLACATHLTGYVLSADDLARVRVFIGQVMAALAAARLAPACEVATTGP